MGFLKYLSCTFLVFGIACLPKCFSQFFIGQDLEVAVTGDLQLTLVNMDFDNNGNFQAGNGTIAFKGSAANPHLGGESITNFFNLAVQLSSSSNMIELENHVEVANKIVFGNGLILLNESNITLASAGTIQNASYNGYLKTNGSGALIKEVGSEGFFFPVGESTYNRLGLQNFGDVDFYSVRVSDHVLSNGVSGFSFQNKAVDATWHIMETTTGGSDLKLTFHWKTENELPGFTRNSITAIHHDGTDWVQVGSTGSATGANPYRFIINNMADLGQFSIYNKCIFDDICQDITVNLGSSGQANITPDIVSNGANMNCNLTSYSLDISHFDCGDIGTNTVILTSSDGNGFSRNCTSQVTVQDLVLPNAHCQNITVQLDATGQASISGAQINNGSTDACGIQTLTVAPASFTCSNVGTNTVTLTVTDVNGNSKTCTSIVTVQDVTPPVAACHDINVILNPTGNYTITPSQINNGSNDICGLSAISVYPNQLACNNVGANTVSLTVSDPSGNSTSCTATVVVEPFVVISQVAVTHETCTGFGNGTIEITATTLGGNLLYSINNGNSYSSSNLFTNLPAASYAVKVLAQETSGCTATSTATITSLGSPVTWFKDIDGDGFSDGTSQTSCIQPTGWYQASQLTSTNGDCNDNDPLQFPGQTWYKDQDGDEYSNGVTLTQCAKPAGYESAANLISTSGDCNDINANIHPGATEICNNLDDDCNGQIDEGLGDLTYVGNVNLTTQAQVNAFSQCYTVVQGNLTIQNAGIDSLAALGNIRKVTGFVTIKITGLDSLSWLLNLDTIGGNLTINNNLQLDMLHGLDNLVRVGGNLKVYNNTTLTNCCAIYELINSPTGVGGTESIYNNDTGCDNIAEINADCNSFQGGNGNNLILPVGSKNAAVIFDEKTVILLPNPASGAVTVQINMDFVVGALRIFNLQGKLMLRRELAENELVSEVPLAGLPAGVYFLETELDGQRLTQRLIVE